MGNDLILALNNGKLVYTVKDGLLGECAGHVSSIQVRNMATIGGNSCNASPSADTAPAMLSLNASACTRREDTEYLLSMDEFYMGAGRTALEQGEVAGGSRAGALDTFLYRLRRGASEAL